MSLLLSQVSSSLQTIDWLVGWRVSLYKGATSIQKSPGVWSGWASTLEPELSSSTQRKINCHTVKLSQYLGAAEVAEKVEVFRWRTETGGGVAQIGKVRISTQLQLFVLATLCPEDGWQQCDRNVNKCYTGVVAVRRDYHKDINAINNFKIFNWPKFSLK